MKKRVLLFVMMLMAGVLLVPGISVNALEDSHYTNGYFFGNGKKIVISERSDGESGASIECDGKTYLVAPTTKVYGGVRANGSSTLESTEIVMNGGNVAAIYGGGMNDGSVVTGTAKITINGGVVGYKNTYTGKLEGGFVYGGGYSGSVNKAVIEYNGGTINEAIIASGSNGCYVGDGLITINAGSPVAAHAIDNSRVGKAKIVVNEGSKYPFIYNGYYWKNGHENVASYVDGLEIEVWGGSQVGIVSTAVKSGDSLVSATTSSKLVYRKSVDIKAISYSPYDTIFKAKEVIGYIQLNVKLGSEVRSQLVPDGLLDQEVVKALEEQVLSRSQLTLDDVKGLYLDEDFKTVYTPDTKVATGRFVDSATIYIKPFDTYSFKLVYKNDDGDEIVVSNDFREGYEITEEELDNLLALLREKAELSDDVKFSYYKDEEMTEEINAIDRVMDQDVVIYVNKVNLKVDDPEDEEKGDVNFSSDALDEAPNTADINLIAILGTIAVGGLGLGYTIKKRKFN